MFGVCSLMPGEGDLLWARRVDEIPVAAFSPRLTKPALFKLGDQYRGFSSAPSMLVRFSIYGKPLARMAMVYPPIRIADTGAESV